MKIENLSDLVTRIFKWLVLRANSKLKMKLNLPCIREEESLLNLLFKNVRHLILTTNLLTLLFLNNTYFSIKKKFFIENLLECSVFRCISASDKAKKFEKK